MGVGVGALSKEKNKAQSGIKIYSIVCYRVKNAMANLFCFFCFYRFKLGTNFRFPMFPPLCLKQDFAQNDNAINA